MSAEVGDNTAASRFEAGTGEDMAQLVYRRRANRLVLIHTEVPEELEGHGLGGALVRAAIDKAAREQLVIVQRLEQFVVLRRALLLDVAETRIAHPRVGHVDALRSGSCDVHQIV